MKEPRPAPDGRPMPEPVCGEAIIADRLWLTCEKPKGHTIFRERVRRRSGPMSKLWLDWILPFALGLTISGLMAWWAYHRG